MKPFEIFRTGKHQPLRGEAIAFGESELAAIAAAYDPALHEAPIVVGHPALNGPAYGWIAGIRVAGDRIVAEARDVNPAFGELVKAKAYKKVSAAFYPPGAANNPAPGTYYLRHVGFLGATPPAVKGLKDIEFAADDDTVVVEFADWQTGSIARLVASLFRRLRERVIETDGTDKADALVSPWDIDQLNEIAGRIEAEQREFAEPLPAPSLPQDPESMTIPNAAAQAAALAAREADLATRQAALDEQAAAFAEREAAEAARARQARAVADAATVAGAIDAGRLPKVLGPAAIALFGELSDEALAFGEGADAVTTTPRQAFADFLAGLPKPVVEGEIATGPAPTVDFADPKAVADAIVSEISVAKEKGEVISSAEAWVRIKERAVA